MTSKLIPATTSVLLAQYHPLNRNELSQSLRLTPFNQNPQSQGPSLPIPHCRLGQAKTTYSHHDPSGKLGSKPSPLLEMYPKKERQAANNGSPGKSAVTASQQVNNRNLIRNRLSCVASLSDLADVAKDTKFTNDGD